MRPLLAHIYDPSRVTYPCWMQPKLNGDRMLEQAGNGQSRYGEIISYEVLQHLFDPLKEAFAPHIILDGEAYKHGLTQGQINGAITPVRKQATEVSKQIELHCFDIIDYTKSFKERFVDLIFPVVPGLVKVETVLVRSETEAEEYYASCVARGYEGAIYRLGDCPYTVPKQHWAQPGPLWNVTKPRGNFLSDKDNRCWHLLKRKDWQDAEFECEGVVEGEGKFIGTLGALLCRIRWLKCMTCGKLSGPVHKTEAWSCQHCHGDGLLTPKQTFSVGSGLTDAQRHYYWNNPPIGKLIKVKYLCLSSDGIPLNPTIHPNHIVQ